MSMILEGGLESAIKVHKCLKWWDLGIFDYQLYCNFTAECNSERIYKIRQYLMTKT